MGDLFLVADLLLQPLQKFRGRDPVHLGVVELKGHRQGGTQPLLPVFAPDKKGGVIAPGVDIHCAVNLVPRQGGGAGSPYTPRPAQSFLRSHGPVR